MTSHSVSFPERTREISAALAPLRRSQAGTMHAFHLLAQSSLEAGALPAKFKELVALALGVAAHCDGCIGFHAKALVALGATRAEVEEVLAVAVYMGGGPSMMYCADALTAFDQFEKLAAVKA